MWPLSMMHWITPYRYPPPKASLDPTVQGLFSVLALPQSPLPLWAYPPLASRHVQTSSTRASLYNDTALTLVHFEVCAVSTREICILLECLLVVIYIVTGFKPITRINLGSLILISETWLLWTLSGAIMAEKGKTPEHAERIMELPVEKLEHMNGFSMDFGKPLIIIMINNFTDQRRIQDFLVDGGIEFTYL